MGTKGFLIIRKFLGALLLFCLVFSFMGPSLSAKNLFAKVEKSVPPIEEGLKDEDLNAGPEDFLERRSAGTISLIWSTIKMLIVLGLVCLVAILSLRFFLPKLGGFRTQEGDFIQILKRIPFEPRKSLYLVRVGEKYHLLGVSDQNINYLIAISKEEIGDLLSNLKDEFSKNKGSFLKVLQNRKFSSRTEKS